MPQDTELGTRGDENKQTERWHTRGLHPVEHEEGALCCGHLETGTQDYQAKWLPVF